MRILRITALAVVLAVTGLASAGSRASADVLVLIDKSTQRMSVSVDGQPRYLWRVSTGRTGFGTPSGTFHPQWMARTYFSKKYYDSPMPHSIFFHGGFAIHGTESIRRLGGPASHGCVRLDPRHAATLFALVQGQGMRATRIVISNAMALRPPARWSKGDAGQARQIGRLTDRLMLSEQIERKEAVAKLGHMRAVDAVRRMSQRDATRRPHNSEDLAVAIGVRSADRLIAPAPAARKMPGGPDTPVVVLPMPAHSGASPLILRVPAPVERVRRAAN